MHNVILSLGSSLGNRYETLQSAVKYIEKEIGTISKISSKYETEPWGFNDDNNFLNMALKVTTKLTPNEVLNKIKFIEKTHKRIKNKNTYEARTLDIDIIFYDSLILNTDDLIIPHKFAHKRNFVLTPLLEIESDFVHPVLLKSVDYLSKNSEDNSKIQKIEIVE